ncbi:hypothetical protein OROMI_020012 [Orobanche minor]
MRKRTIKMEAAVSAYAVNSKWRLGLGLGRQRGDFGSSKQILSLSIGGVGCCNWSSRKRNIILNCTRGFRLESTWMGMRPGPPTERQSFNWNGRSAASGSAQGYVENTAPVLPYLGVGAVMLGIGYHLGSLLSSSGNTSSAAVAARVLLVAANIIVHIFLWVDDCVNLLFNSCRMINVTTSTSLLLNVKSSHDVDTFARFIALKTAGVPLKVAQALVDEMKDITQSKFDSLLKNIHLDEQHKKVRNKSIEDGEPR